MTGIAVGISLQIVLMLGLCFPEIPRRSDLRHDLSRPSPRRIDVGDGLLGDALLFIAGVEDRRSIALAPIVTLAIPRARIMDLEEKLEHSAVAHFGGIKNDLDR